MNKCLKNIQLQLGFDKTVTFSTNSSKPAKLEILRNGALVASFAAGDFLGNDFSSEFGTGVFEFLIEKSEIQKLFDLDRFFDFRLVVGGELFVFGGLRIFGTLPTCANNQKPAANFETKIETIEPEKPYVLPDIDTLPISDAENELESFFEFITKKHNYNGFY